VRQLLFVDKSFENPRILSMIGYTKLFGSIITSTIWCEDNETRIVWVTMLALRNPEHIVEGSVPGLAAMARVSVKACRVALEKLSSPDPDSRTKEFEGRRIEVTDGGWVILNGEKYRRKMNSDERREYFRIKQAESRARKKAVKQLSKKSKTVKDKLTVSTQSETETETETDQGGDPPAPPPRAREKALPGVAPPLQSVTGRRAVTVGEVILAGAKAGVSEADCRAWFTDMELCGWKKVDGTPFGNWPRELCIHRDRLRERHERTKTHQSNHKPTPSEIRNSRIMGADEASANAVLVVERQERERERRRLEREAAEKKSATDNLASKVARP
jgi:hypothetical protein